MRNHSLFSSLCTKKINRIYLLSHHNSKAGHRNKAVRYNSRQTLYDCSVKVNDVYCRENIVEKMLSSPWLVNISIAEPKHSNRIWHHCSLFALTKNDWKIKFRASHNGYQKSSDANYLAYHYAQEINFNKSILASKLPSGTMMMIFQAVWRT